MTTTNRTQSTTARHAQDLLENPNYRFTIREAGGRVLRRHMSASRFLAKRDGYQGRSGLRVDVVDITDDTPGMGQTWDLSLTKRYWG